MKVKKIDGNLKFFIRKGVYSNRIDSRFSGEIESIKGFLKERGYRGKETAVKTDVYYTVSINDSEISAEVKTDLLSIILP
ncbi:MAG: hypothetical protein Q9M89_08945 [Persephonella sp.]|nr:hypothetical protein [Persephonella sp.]